jgi:polysaccharide biosynthesis protein PslJ
VTRPSVSPRLASNPAGVAGGHRWAADARTIAIACGFLVLAAAVLTGRGISVAATALALGAVLAAWRPSTIPWSALIGSILAIILFVPIGRYSLPINLPFGVELYRVAIALVLLCWVAALLVDPRVRLRRSPLDLPLAVIMCATLGSVVVNVERTIPLETAVLKGITFFLSFILLYFMIVSVIRSGPAIQVLTKLLVCGTAAVSVSAVVEQRRHFNLFDHVGTVLPFLRFEGTLILERDGVVRAVASAGHPIALGVLFATMLPVSLALAFSAGRRWWLPAGLIMVGVMASASRTPVLVFVASSLVLLWLRPKQVKALLPLVLPMIVVIKLALPGSLATVKNAFFPEGGLVEEQQTLAAEADPLLAGGRLRQLGPMLREASRTPLLGQGFATRQTGLDNPLRNAPILDDQWLGLLLEIGIIGVVGWVALISGSARRLGRYSRTRAGPQGWLAAGFAAAIVGFGVGMFTYDSLGFVQQAFVFWIILGLSASLLLVETDEIA